MTLCGQHSDVIVDGTEQRYCGSILSIMVDNEATNCGQHRDVDNIVTWTA